MNAGASSRDLIVLAADKNIEAAVKGLLHRTESLATREPSTDIFVHPHRDPGCLRKSVDFLRAYSKQYLRAIVIFDREGCGEISKSRIELEEGLESGLFHAGWGDRVAAIVLDPELEIWVWSDSPEVPQVLGWPNAPPDLSTWLISKGFIHAAGTKPQRPKEAVEAAIRRARKPRSSALYFELASRVSVRRCSDPAFAKLKMVLKNWFPK